MNALELRNLSKSFGGVQVINDLTLTIPKGQRHAIIGPNGAGKTTLFNMVTGWLAPTSGQIWINGHQSTSDSPDEVARSGLARSFQKNMLLDGLTVLENLRIACQARHAARRSFLRSRLSFSDILENAHRTACQMSLEDVLGVQVSALSYGQKRQLEVAVALCAEPKILLMDEPAAGTSPAERERLISLIAKLPRDLTVVLVEHDMDVVFSVCDVITVLSYGKVLATGGKDDIRSNQDVIDAYLGREHA